MKTMIWKELRENGRWAALALAGLLVAEIFALSSSREAIGEDSTGITLCSNTFLLVSTFGCIAIGATLGALQILPERRRDQWASLLHRPVSRRTIFLGKVAAGLLLHVLATCLPLLASAGYAAWPGRFAAPFLPAMALPALSDVLLGGVFYFAALLLGMHPGKWTGSRAAIALSAIGILLLHLEGKWPFLLPLGACAVLGIAAAAAIHGSLRRRSWPGRLAFGLVVLAGTTMVALFTGLGLRAISTQTVSYPYATSLSITTDGRVLKIKYYGSKKTPTIHDMEGNVITDERYVGNQGHEYFLTTYLFANRELKMNRRPFFQSPRASREYLETVAGSYDGPEVWYRIPGPRSYFIGYDKLSARCIGICDADGFKDGLAEPNPFTSEPEGDWYQAPPLLYRIGSHLRSFDFAERQMKTLLDVGDDAIYGAVRFPYNSEPQRIAVSLENSIRILDLDGKAILTMPYGHDPNVWNGISITAVQDFSRMFLQYAPSFMFVPKSSVNVMHLDVIDGQGQRIASYETIFDNSLSPRPNLPARIAGLTDMPIPTLLATLAGREEPRPYYVMSKFRLARAWERGVFIPLFAVALILCGVAAFWARRAGLSIQRTAVWVALTFVFGVAGFLAYRFATDWPARVRCPQCGRMRSISTNTCPHCQEAWATPAPNGAEIFEPAG